MLLIHITRFNHPVAIRTLSKHTPCLSNKGISFVHLLLLYKKIIHPAFVRQPQKTSTFYRQSLSPYFKGFDQILQDRRWNAKKPSATLDP